MESVYHFVTIHVNETSWAHVWRLRSRYLETGYDTMTCGTMNDWPFVVPLDNGRSLVSRRCAPLLPNVVKTEASPRYSNGAMKPSARSLLHASSY
jgi:hypothetical protein